MRFRWIGWDAVAAPGEGTSRLLIFARGMRSVGEESEESLPILECARRTKPFQFSILLFRGMVGLSFTARMSDRHLSK